MSFFESSRRSKGTSTVTKKTKRTKQSDGEKARRPQQRQGALATLQPLLYRRAQVQRLLNCSRATLLRLEKKGRLVPIKLDPQAPTAMTFYTAANVHTLAGSVATIAET